MSGTKRTGNTNSGMPCLVKSWYELLNLLVNQNQRNPQNEIIIPCDFPSTVRPLVSAASTLFNPDNCLNRHPVSACHVSTILLSLYCLRTVNWSSIILLPTSCFYSFVFSKCLRFLPGFSCFHCNYPMSHSTENSLLFSLRFSGMNLHSFSKETLETKQSQTYFFWFCQFYLTVATIPTQVRFQQGLVSSLMCEESKLKKIASVDLCCPFHAKWQLHFEAAVRRALQLILSLS